MKSTSISSSPSNSSSTKAQRILKGIRSRRDTLLQEYPDLASQVQEIKSRIANNLQKSVEKAVSSLKSKGCHVTLAKDTREAQEQILKILAGHQSVAMSKNSVFTEIALREYLKSKNVEVLDTDLGERVAGTKVDAHPWIASINTPIPNKEWVAQIKDEIKQQAAQMQYGITGAEAIVEENGTLALLESEGNVRFTSNLPYNHIVVAGIDKIVPSLEDALTVCRATSVYGMGKDVLKYISFISGPSRTADIEFRMVQGMHGPKEVYVILLDNGRLAAAENQQWDLLKCLHCGGCLVDCPQYLGEGLERGYYYTGKKAQVLAAFLEGSKQVDAADCGDCSLCNKTALQAYKFSFAHFREVLMQFEKITKPHRTYQEVLKQINKLIIGGKLRPGDRLMGEREMAVELGVSRTTLREALRTMEFLGWVEIIPGDGTFIRNAQLNEVISPLALALSAEPTKLEEL